ncbi:MAG: hypothetical protein FK734_01160 [Asgard group archaeon]|nr:hypothetical protein [Asgard group archaeon]
MLNKKSTLIGIFAIILSLSSLTYFPLSMAIDNIPIKEIEIDDSFTDNQLTDVAIEKPIISDEIIAQADNTTLTPGSYKTQAYFTQNKYISMGGYSQVFEWEKYEDVYNDPSNFAVVDFWQNNDTTNPTRNWHPLDTYGLLWSSSRIGSYYMPSIIYTPAYSEDTYIQGNVYFMCGGDMWRSAYSEWFLRMTLERYNPQNGQADYLTETIGQFWDTDENPNGSYDGTNYDGYVYEGILPNTTLIPAGYRLRATIECMLTSASYNYAQERLELRTGSTIYPTEWTVDSDNDIYDNYYHIQESRESIGIQLLMYQETYPTIELTGLENNTIYYTSTEGTITVSSESVLSQYRWDQGPFTPFTTQQVVTVPQTTGWHELLVKAYDWYDNLAEATYYIGYDTTPTNVYLYSPSNNSKVSDGYLLNFSIIDFNDAAYEWDKNGTENVLTTPFDIYPYIGTDGIHQLTIHVDDDLGSEMYEYFFNFDNTGPELLLVNVENETTLPQQKNIDLIIDDDSYPIDVQYKWDSDSYATWTPILGNFYRAYLPSIAGWHYLSVLANDSFGNEYFALYAFNTSLTLLNVDLYNLVNNSYYLGGNTVEVAITNHNNTIYYYWGSDPWTAGTAPGGIMTLSGGDALSSSPGTYILTVIVGSLVDNEEYTFKFIFTVDQMAPTLIPDAVYNESRFLDTAIFSYTISDNLTSVDNLVIYYSFDGDDNHTLQLPHQIYLYGLDDGLHNLTIIVYDIAGNYYYYYITFTIDTTSPSTSVSIIGQAIVNNIRYIPANTEIIVAVSDDDPGVSSYYKWNSTTYIPFIDSFFLPAIEGYSRLDVLANDTLGNTRVRTYWLTIDGTAPSITLSPDLNNSKINDITLLSFQVTDLLDDTIYQTRSKWDIVETSAPEDPLFTTYLLPTYKILAKIEAILSVYTQDVVGNDYNYTFHFYLDFLAPSYALVSATNSSYITGGELLDFNVLSADIGKFLYKWDDAEDYSEISDPWDIMAPIVDGNHTLLIRLEDQTGGGIYPNFVVATYVFIIDDIELIFMLPEEFESDYYYTMNYGEEFNFSINIRDRVNQTEIEGLVYDITKDVGINLSITISQFNETVYNITILATNVTNNAFTIIDFEFYQFTTNKQLVRVNIKINKQIGNFHIINYSNEIVFEDDIYIIIQLRDLLDVNGQEILYLSLNGTVNNFEYTLIDAVNYIYNLTLNSADFMNKKGDWTFEFYTFSNFYYAYANATSSISIEIQPISIVLTVGVNNLEVIYDSDLVVTALLTRSDTTPIQYVTIVFTFEIHYKNGTVSIVYLTTSTNINGEASESIRVTEDMEYIIVSASYAGGDYYDPISQLYANNIYAISAGLSTQIILIIVAAAVLFSIIIGFVIYRLVRARPFEELLEKVTDEDITKNMEKVSPGVVLTIFDQRKGPIPLISNHSLDTAEYSRRMRIGVDNFLLKIADQAYSSLGFEEHDERRRIGSINLPNEDMIGFIHGVQLANPIMRGGFENLSLIVLAEKDIGSLLLANQEFMFLEIDQLIKDLQDKKPLEVIKQHLDIIRKRSVQIMLAAQKNVKEDKKNKKEYQ